MDEEFKGGDYMQPVRHFITKEQKELALELFKAHFTPKEASLFFPCGYQTLANLFRGFTTANISKYDRLTLIEEEEIHDQIKSIAFGTS